MNVLFLIRVCQSFEINFPFKLSFVIEEHEESEEEDKYSLTSSETEEEEEEEVMGPSGKKYVNGEIVELGEKKPDIRKSGTISIKFSERVFPSPARESTLLQEQEVQRKFFFFYFI